MKTSHSKFKFLFGRLELVLIGDFLRYQLRLNSSLGDWSQSPPVRLRETNPSLNSSLGDWSAAAGGWAAGDCECLNSSLGDWSEKVAWVVDRIILV